jgi:hypothetical protein
MFNKRVFLILCVLVFFAVSLSACSKKEGDEPTKYRSQAGLEKLTKQAARQQSKGAGSIANNPEFFGVGNQQLASAEAKDLDNVIRPVLKKIFGDARVIAESKSAETQRDGEIVENKFTYVVSKLLVREDGKALHTALHSAGFGLSPRLGSEPTTWSGGAIMSLFRRTSLRSYSLVIKMDTRKQQIVVESYRLGSRYDRLM